MSCWLPALRRHDDDRTMGEVTPTTHGAPLLNDLDPGDETVVALTTHADGDDLLLLVEGHDGGLR